MDSLEDDVYDIVVCDALDLGTGKNTWTNEALVSRGTDWCGAPGVDPCKE